MRNRETTAPGLSRRIYRPSPTVPKSPALATALRLGKARPVSAETTAPKARFQFQATGAPPGASTARARPRTQPLATSLSAGTLYPRFSLRVFDGVSSRRSFVTI
jgi:hypothetical protein